MSSQYDVSVVGLYILDILGRHMDTMPPAGGAIPIDEIRLTVAGTAGGTIVDCAKLGLSAYAVGSVGEDEKAGFMRYTMESHGIDTSGMKTVPGAQSSATILPILPSGERTAWPVRGASMQLSLTDDEVERALASRIVHLGGTGRLGEFDGEPSRELLRRAKAAGRTTTFDLIGAKSEVSELVDPLMPYVDYFIPSEDETERLTGMADVEAAAEYYLDKGAANCLITMGPAGSFLASRDGFRCRVPALSDIQVVDTTGCGDAYSAGIITGLAQGWDLTSCAYFATAASGLVATGLGSDAGIVSFEATRELAERHRRENDQ